MKLTSGHSIDGIDDVLACAHACKSMMSTARRPLCSQSLPDPANRFSAREIFPDASKPRRLNEPLADSAKMSLSDCFS